MKTTTIQSFRQKVNSSTQKMPLLFLGNGSSKNVNENSKFSQNWKQLGKTIQIPKAVICISVHWLTQGTFTTAVPKPKTIHNFSGFPKSLFEV